MTCILSSLCFHATIEYIGVSERTYHKSNRISRFFDIFITVTIFCNIAVMFLQTFDQFAAFSGVFKVVEYGTLFIFCIEYGLRIWTSELLYPMPHKWQSVLRFLT